MWAQQNDLNANDTRVQVVSPRLLPSEPIAHVSELRSSSQTLVSLAQQLVVYQRHRN